MSSVRIPNSDTSDLDKINMRIFISMFKVLQGTASIDATFFVSPTNIQYFNDIIAYIIQHFEESVDKNLKRIITVLLKDLFIDLSGLQDLSQFGKRSAQEGGVIFTQGSSYS